MISGRHFSMSSIVSFQAISKLGHSFLMRLRALAMAERVMRET